MGDATVYQSPYATVAYPISPVEYGYTGEPEDLEQLCEKLEAGLDKLPQELQALIKPADRADGPLGLEFCSMSSRREIKHIDKLATLATLAGSKGYKTRRSTW